MELRNLGASGLKVSPLCFGAMTFGEPDDTSFMHQVASAEAVVSEMLETALAAGVNFIDTADVYGQDGLSERVLGRWFAETGRRDEVVLATKFRFPMPYGKGASRRHIVKACEESLRRLGTDRIDLYQVHMQDSGTPEEETLRALDDLVRAGKVLYVGVSNYAAYRLVDALWTSRHAGLNRYVSAQMQYSLLERSIEREHVPVCRDFGVGILPWSPLARGFLTGKYRKDQPPPEGGRLTRWKRFLEKADTPRSWAVLAAMDTVVEETGASHASVALAWLLAQPCVTSVIFGARTVAQVEANLAAAELSLSADQLERLDQASRLSVGYPYDFLRSVDGRW